MIQQKSVFCLIKVGQYLTIASRENRFWLCSQDSVSNPSHIYQKMTRGLHDIPWFRMFDTRIKQCPSQLVQSLSFPISIITTWAASWQNQQNVSATSEDSDRPGHLPSLIRVFVVRMKKACVFSYPLNAQRRLIRLGGCPGWSESSLGAQSFCWFCHEAAHMMLHLLQVYQMLLKWYKYMYHLSLVTRKPVFRVSDQGRLKLQCSSIETSYSLEILDIASRGIILSKQRTTKCWSDCADAQADLRLCCWHMTKTGFLMTWLICSQVFAGSILRSCETFFRADLVMESFLWPFSPYYWLK